MDWQASLRWRLLQDAPVAAIVGTRVDWIVTPPPAKNPRVVLLVVSEPEDVTYKGPPSLRRALVQVDCWADSARTAKGLMDACLAALRPAVRLPDQQIRFTPTVLDQGPRDLGEGDENGYSYRKTADLRVFFASI